MIDETVREIKEMRTHSSSAVAIKAAAALHSLTERDARTVEEFLSTVERNARMLRQANPSHASLHSTMHQIVDEANSADDESVEEAKSTLARVIDENIDRIERATDRAAAAAMDVIGDGDRILTHDFSTTVLAYAEHASAADRHHEFVVTEARPRVMGRRMARHLADLDEADVTLIVDSAAGHVLEDVDRVLIGMDCIVDGVLYNRVGTYALAACAHREGVPVSVIGAETKLIDRGFVFTNDYRSSVEVIREPTPEFAVENPAYDATPMELVTSVITDAGVKTTDSATTTS